MLISGVIDPLTLCENVKGNTLSHWTVVPSGDGNTLRRWISRSATHRVRVGRAGEREKRRLPTYKLFGSLRGRQECEAVRLPDLGPAIGEARMTSSYSSYGLGGLLHSFGAKHKRRVCSKCNTYQSILNRVTYVLT